ncbi:MAG: TonB-dependent receptor, partial [Paludibacteraceae bacterium]|nr:TonB-dependent receptor [Paludibacteraceae bacterium]
MKKALLIILCIMHCALCIDLFAQESTGGNFTGSVIDDKGEAVIGAEIFWLNTTIGAVTDIDGNFTIPMTADSHHLVFNYLSYKSDTVDITTASIPLVVQMSEDTKELQEVTVAARGASTIASRVSALQTTKITGAELCKAACCNLSESFETNASVDVAYADAATGAKTIKLLGLSGTYVQLLTENTPGVRGLAQNYGMEYIPGAWMESIQVSKGTSSVINGYEATTGQINVEYLKPQTQDPIALNGMVSTSLRAELNATGGWDINEKWSTGVLAHYKNESMEHDTNGDGFMDLPKGQQANLLNRWYMKDGAYTGQYLVRGLYDERNGGQTMQYIADNNIADPYKIGIRTWRMDAFMKQGYVFDEAKGTSIGIIASGSYHNQHNIYGHRVYDGVQGNFYLNAMFQTYFDETDKHKITAGLSLNYDNYNEVMTLCNNAQCTTRGLEPWRKMHNAQLIVNGTENSTLDMTRDEWTPGVFAEYSLKVDEKLSLLAGVRGDYSTQYGFFVTPRFNVRYSPWEWWNLRGSVGMGYRSPNLLSDHASVLPSSRQIIIENDVLNQERAVNAGASTTFYIPIAGRELQITADYYYTHFLECMVVDMDSDPYSVIFSNLTEEGVEGGKKPRSYAGNFQVEASMEILKGWTMTLAYRMSDVKSTINGELREKPLTNRYKALITTSYMTPLKHWQFDVTAQFNGGG